MKHHKLRFWLASLSLLLCAPILRVGAAQPAKTSSNPNVTTTISDGCLLGSDDVKSGADSYTSLGSDEVSASGPGELSDCVLNLGDGNLTGRTIHVALTPLSSSTIPVNYYTGIVSSGCYDSNLNEISFWTLGVGTVPKTQPNCSLNLNVDSYLVGMSPEYPGSTTVTYTINSPNKGPCTSWTTAGNGTDVLIQDYGTKKATTAGQATISFSITVALDELLSLRIRLGRIFR